MMIKKFGFVILILILILHTAGCIAEDHAHHRAELVTSPAPVNSGISTEFIFTIKDRNNLQTTDLEIIHEKPIHLFMVSNDLSQYFHQHPEQNPDGSFRLNFTFPNGGKFKLFADYKPKNAEQTVSAFDVPVGGQTLPEAPLIPDKIFEKSVDGIRVKMKAAAALVKKKDVLLAFDVFDAATGEKAGDLQDYLGEKAHFVIIRKGLGRFVHVHPARAGDKGMKPKMENHGSAADFEIRAMTRFPNSGIYKLFAQFKRNEKVITVPFVFEVK